MPAEYTAPDWDYWGTEDAWNEACNSDQSVEDKHFVRWVAESYSEAEDDIEDGFPGKLIVP